MRFSRSRLSRRKGIATLELVMCLPILLSLLALIIQVGASMGKQAEVIARARHDAWGKRFNQTTGEPLVFKAGSGEVSATTTDNVAISPIFSAFPQLKSTDAVLAGSWDHRQITDMNKLINSERMGGALKNMPGNLGAMIEGALADLAGLGQSADDIGKQIERFVEQALQGVLGQLGLPDADAVFDKIKSETTNQKQKLSEEKNKVTEAAAERVKALTTEIEGIDTDIKGKEEQILKDSKLTREQLDEEKKKVKEVLDGLDKGTSTEDALKEMPTDELKGDRGRKIIDVLNTEKLRDAKKAEQEFQKSVQEGK